MTTFPEYGSFDALALANLVQRGVVSPAELLDAAIERAEHWNPHINAIIYKMYEHARLAVHAKIPRGLFTGVPFLLKDFLADYAGVPLSSGSRFTQHWVPKHDSALVTHIKEAGLIVFGKTNVPEFGLSSMTEPELFGPTRNPWNLAHTPGGSSGGSAAAVAAGIVPMAHGNDGAGSIRIPASYCGLFGLKPSRSRTAVGSELLRMWESMVVEHVLTRSVRDSAAMLDVLSGHGLEVTPALPPQSVSFLSDLSKPLRPLQIALTDQPFFPAAVASDYVMSVHKAGALCQQLGHSVEVVTMKINSAEVARAYLMMIAGEMTASLKRFSVAMKANLKNRDIERQTMLINHIGEHISAADVSWARATLEAASLHMTQFFSDYDVLMTPTMAAPAPLIGGLKPDLFETSVLELLTHVPFASLLHKALDHAALKNFAYYPFTPIFNISGQPAMSVPMYWDAQGMPIGIQFAARYGEESLLLQLAQQIEEAQPWFAKQPELKPVIL
jgi:amidase